MRKVLVPVIMFALGAAVAVWLVRARPVEGQATAPQPGFSAVPGAIGSQDRTGPYEVVKGWPKDISTLPGNEKWTYGAGRGVFAESPNRIFMLFRGELPKMEAPRATLTAPSSCPTATPGRASRSSTRTGSSSWTGASRGIRPMKRAPAT